ncbi:MAG: response regulator transcription factor [Candidatus Moraniibacteriota bacterium]
MKILVVEDEPAIARIIKNGLERSGHLVDHIDDGAEAMERMEIYDYDLAILDVFLPGADGFEVCRHIRKIGLDLKILMLTAKSDLDSKVLSLNIGADDYMTKPFSLEELNARVRALGRREKLSSEVKLKVDSLVLDLATRTATINNKPLKITLTEFKLLEYLIRNQNRFCTRTMLSENVWGEKENISNTVTATISRLKAKMKKLNNNSDLIHTVPKSGYRIY